MSQYLNIAIDDMPVCAESSKKILEPNRGGDAYTQRNAMLLAAYRISDDDKKLRQWYSQQQKSISAFFDQLRKNYPVRRDYSHCVVPDWMDKKQHKHFLRALECTDFQPGHSSPASW